MVQRWGFLIVTFAEIWYFFQFAAYGGFLNCNAAGITFHGKTNTTSRRISNVVGCNVFYIQESAVLLLEVNHKDEEHLNYGHSGLHLEDKVCLKVYVQAQVRESNLMA